jgi:transcription initiation factor TFIIIB Brf1 subunit/transcription initiation factor TFIIB
LPSNIPNRKLSAKTKSKPSSKTKSEIRDQIQKKIDNQEKVIIVGEGRPVSLANYEKGFATTISPSNVDASGSQVNINQLTKMRNIQHNWNQMSSNNRSYHRNLKNAFGVLLRIKDKLSLSDTITEKSAYYYRKVVEKRITKGRSIKELVVACVYVACREMDVPRTLDEIAEIANADKVYSRKYYRFLLRDLRIRLNPSIDSAPINYAANHVSSKILIRLNNLDKKITELMLKSGDYGKSNLSKDQKQQLMKEFNISKINLDRRIKSIQTIGLATYLWRLEFPDNQNDSVLAKF